MESNYSNNGMKINYTEEESIIIVNKLLTQGGHNLTRTTDQYER